MSLFLINPYILKIIAQVGAFIFGTKDKEVSNNLQYSGRSIVRTRGVGNDAYQSINTTIGTSHQIGGGVRTTVRTLTGILYEIQRQTGGIEMQKSTDDGATFTEQDSVNRPDGDTRKVTCAIDSTDLIGVLYWDNGVGLRYVTFNTTTDLWGTPETVVADTPNNALANTIAIAFDTNDVPHVTYTDSLNDHYYRNNVSGSWTSNTRLLIGSTPCKTDIAIDNKNDPIIMRLDDASNELTVYEGTSNDATGFFGFDVNLNCDFFGVSMAIDKKNNVYFSYIVAGDVKIRKHVATFSGDWVNTFDDEVNVATGTFEDTSMTIDQAGDIYVFSTSSTNITNYWKSTNEGRTWGTAQTDDMPTILDERVRVRWSLLNHHQPYKLDYTLDINVTILFNTVLVDTFEKWRSTDNLFALNNNGSHCAKNMVRDSTGAIYIGLRELTANDAQMFKSTDEGVTFAEVDSGGAPTGINHSTVSCAIDSADQIHVVWWDAGVGLRYVIFNTITDTWGTPETAQTQTNAPLSPFTAITIDSNDKPHVLFVDENGNSDESNYTNKTTGSWSTNIVVDVSVSNSKFDITINGDDIPQFAIVGSDLVLTAQIGNLNNPTSFTSFTINTGAVTDLPSMAIDKKGNTYVCWIEVISDHLETRTHLSGDAWTTWQAQSNIDGQYEDTTIVIDALDRPIIMGVLGIGQVTFAWRSSDNGVTWVAVATSHDTVGFDDDNIKARWSFLNYHFPTEIDYTLRDLLESDMLYNKLVQTGKDILYVVGRNPTNSDTEVWRSATEGQTWEQVDGGNAPINVDGGVSCAIDGLDNIHIFWWKDDTGDVKYITFDISTQLYGTEESVADPVSGELNPNPETTAIVDWNNVPHVSATVQDAVTDQDIIYSNRVGGVWDGWILYGAVGIFKTEIAFGIDNIPRFIHCKSNNHIQVLVGDQNDLSTFTVFNFPTADTVLHHPSICVDSKGNTHIAYIESDRDIKTRNFNEGGNWTSDWDAQVDVASGTFEDVSMMVDERDNLLIMSNDSATGLSQAFVSTDNGTTWEAVVTDNMPNVVDEQIRLRWSLFHFESPSKVDYTIFDATANDVYYNSGAIT